jgi:hypothetical protein
MGAGHASSTLYKCSPNLPSGGGNKKQGITSRVGLNNWENREIQTQSNGIGRFKFHFMNQLGGVEPGHSMFGGRWNRADGLSRQIEQKQLEVEIKEDENNGVIIPLEKRLLRSTRVRSTPNDYTLTLLHEDETTFTFSINPNWFGYYNTITFASTPTVFNETIKCNSCSIDVYCTISNYTFTIYKNNIQNIQSVKITGNGFDTYPDGSISGNKMLGEFTWKRP